MSISEKTESNELIRFHQFVAQQLESGVELKTIDEAVDAFHATSADVVIDQSEISESLERSLNGESEPLNMAEIKSVVADRLQQRGISG